MTACATIPLTFSVFLSVLSAEETEAKTDPKKKGADASVVAWGKLVADLNKRAGEEGTDPKAAAETALKEMEAFAKAHPNSEGAIHALYNVGELATKLRDHERALKSYATAARQAKGLENKAFFAYKQGLSASGLGRYESAEKLFSAALSQTKREDFKLHLGQQLKVNQLYKAKQSIRPGTVPPPFTAKTITGKDLSLAGLKGKVVLIDFWAVRCPPCRQQIPIIKELYRKYHHKGFEVIGINSDEMKETCVEFVEEHEMNWHNVYDKDRPEEESLGLKYGSVTIPHMLLVGRDGKVTDVELRDEGLTAAVDKAFADK